MLKHQLQTTQNPAFAGFGQKNQNADLQDFQDKNIRPAFISVYQRPMIPP